MVSGHFFLTIQSGAPFTVLNGEDPAGALSGIDGLVGNAIRPNLATSMDLSTMSIPQILAQCGTAITVPPSLKTGVRAFLPYCSRTTRQTAGRNILRGQGLRLVDFGIIKNTRISENVRFQVRADMFNVLNTRNFGIPEGCINAPNFLNQWATNGGNRRIILGARIVF